MNQNRDREVRGTPRDRRIELKIRTHLEQRVRAGFVFGREWRRVEVTAAVARQFEEDPELSIRELRDDETDEIPEAAHVGQPTNLIVPEPTGPKALAEQRRRAEAAIAAREAEARAQKAGTEPASPPEGPAGGGKRGDERKS